MAQNGIWCLLPPPSAIKFSVVGYFEALAPTILCYSGFFFLILGGKVADFYELPD